MYVCMYVCVYVCMFVYMYDYLPACPLFECFSNLKIQERFPETTMSHANTKRTSFFKLYFIKHIQ